MEVFLKFLTLKIATYVHREIKFEPLWKKKINYTLVTKKYSQFCYQYEHGVLQVNKKF